MYLKNIKYVYKFFPGVYKNVQRKRRKPVKTEKETKKRRQRKKRNRQ